MSSALHRHRLLITDWLVLIGCFIFSYWLMNHTFQYHNQSFVIASKLWSDFGAHIPLIRSFSFGHNWPPEYPTFPGEPIRYHYLFYLAVAGLEKIGVNLGLALNLLSAAGLTLLLFMIFKITRLLFSPFLVGLLALVLFLFNGSLSFLEFFTKFPLSSHSLSDIVSAIHFVSFGPWDGKWVSAFWNLNIYTNQRHLGLSFGLALLALYPFVKVVAKRGKPTLVNVILTAVCLLVLPLLHQAGFIMVLIVGGMLALLDIRQWRLHLPLVFTLLACSLPGLIITQSMRTGLPAVWQIGFLAKNPEPLTILTYWLYNLGAYLILIPIMLIVIKPPQRRFLAAFFPLFLLANVVRLSPDMINNHKLINFFMIGVVIITSGFLAWLWRRHFLGKLLAPLLFVLLIFSGIIDFFPIYNDNLGELPDVGRRPEALWITAHTDPASVFITTTYFYNPASLAGRKTFVDYGYFNWSMGYNDQPRRQLVQAIFASDTPISTACSLLYANRLNYLLIAPGKGEVSDEDPHQSPIVKDTLPVYTSPDGYTIYDVNHSCSQS